MDKQNPQGNQVASSPLFKKFLGTAEEYLRKPTRLKQLLNDAYQKASQKKDLGTIAHEAWDTLQTLFRLIRASSSGEYQGLPTTTVVAAVAVIIYFLSPIDLIPDFLPVLGLLDDVALVAWFGATIKGEMDKFAEWEKTRVTDVTDDAPEHAAHKAAAEATAANLTAKPATTQAPVEAPAAQAPVPASPNTDAGLGSPDSSQPAPARISSPAAPAAKPHADAAANTTDSSRESSKSGATHPAGGDPGGNVR